MVIRGLGWGDFDSLVDNYFALYDEVLDNPDLGISLFPQRPTRGEEAEWFADLYRAVEEGHAVARVAEEDRRAIALCTVRRRGPHREALHIGVLGISVARAWRRRGLGRQLIASALEGCAGKFELVELSVFATNQHARTLYASLGFREWGTLARGVLRDGRYTDIVHMVLVLSPPARGPAPQ
jgi:RimJ/RimL family protein N-acetyltransferase